MTSLWTMSTDILFFAVTATLLTITLRSKKVVSSSDTCSNMKNSAFVFVKPHANTPAVQQLVREKLVEAGCTILTEEDISGKTIDEQKLIDQHYYAIGTFVTLVFVRPTTSAPSCCTIIYCVTFLCLCLLLFY